MRGICCVGRSVRPEPFLPDRAVGTDLGWRAFGKGPKLSIVKSPWIAIAFVLSTLAAASGCARSGSGSDPGFGSGLAHVPASPGIEKQEREMFARLNRDRKERGLPPLKYDTRLANVARFHSADMRDHRFFDHDSPTSGSLEDRLNAAGYLFLNARENLSEAPDVQTGQDSLLASPGHYANIVATDTTHVGIGIVKGGVEARENLTITQVFARPGRAESAGAGERAVVQRIQSERATRGLARAQRHSKLDELAREHIDELDPETTPDSLGEVGKRINDTLAEAKKPAFRGIVVGAQLLPDSESFVVPASLLDGAKASFGIAVRQVKNETGRPQLQVLLLVGR